MAFPVTVSPVTQVAEAPGRFGPFTVGMNLYVINSVIPDLMTGDTFLAAFKSTDGGATWVEQDSANRPLADGYSVFAPVVFTCCQSSADDTQIYAVYHDPNLDEQAVQVFDAGSDTWGAVLGNDNIGVPVSCCYRASDNSIVIASSRQSMNGQHKIPAFSVFDISGGTFGSLTPMDTDDYTDPTVWDQLPCGIVQKSDGVVRVYSQQSTRRSLDNVQTLQLSDGSFQIPFDCPEITLVECVGGGGGGGGGGGQNGGGAGGNYNSAGPLTVTPLSSVPVTVGTGGAQNTDGTESNFNSLARASGGHKGTAGGGGTSGALGSHLGGKGGDPAGTAAGGGGGAAAPGGDGSAGANSDGTNGGVGGNAGPGASETGSGNGGTGGTTLFSQVDGQDGNDVGGGGGGGADAGGLGVGTGGIGGQGLVQITYTPSTADNPSRMWYQDILADNSLGVLTEIPEGTFPIDGQIVPFDCAAGNDLLVIVFTWVTATGKTLISVGQATNDGSFSFSSFSIGTTSGLDPEPSIALNGAAIAVAYVAANSLTDVNFVYRINGGSAVQIGSFADSGCRLQASIFSSQVIGTFGTPQKARVSFLGDEAFDSLILTAVKPGIIGNLITFTLTPVLNGPATAISTVAAGINQFQIEVQYGYTIDSPDNLLVAADWAAIATAINTDPSASAVVTAVGSSTNVASLSGALRLVRGNTGQG